MTAHHFPHLLIFPVIKSQIRGILPEQDFADYILRSDALPLFVNLVIQ